MTPDLIRSIWKVLQKPGTLELSRSSPDRLVSQLILALREQGQLPPESELKVKVYIQSRIPLICDLLIEGYLTRSHCEVLLAPESS